MEWRDRGILLAVRPFGEADSLAYFLTRGHGLASGLIKGGISRKQRPFLQAGNTFDITWKARLADQLGFFACDPVKLLGASLYGEPARLAALASGLAVLHDCLAAADANGRIFEITEKFIDSLAHERDCLLDYANWERELLKELGFELCLDKCNATGTREDLCYISPKTGHAVCRAAGELYKDVLLPLPEIWNGGRGGCVKEALNVLEYFYRKRIYSESGREYPFIRASLAKYAEAEGLQKAA